MASIDTHAPVTKTKNIEECLQEINSSLGKISDSDPSLLTHELALLEEKEDVNKVVPNEALLTSKYLTPSVQFSNAWLNKLQKIVDVPYTKFSDNLYESPEFTYRTGIKFHREGLDANIVSFKEYPLPLNGAAETSKTSLSLTRQYNPKSSYTQGRSESIPFAPGGLVLPAASDEQAAATALLLHTDKDGLYDIPPGFPRGLDTEKLVASSQNITALTEQIALNEANDTINEEEEEDGDNNLGIVSNDIDSDGKEETYSGDDNNEVSIDNITEALGNIYVSENGTFDSTAIDLLLPKDITYGRVDVQEEPVKAVKQWAHVVDVNKTLDNFDELVPYPAKTFPFELDTFQKEAVSHLEQGDSVFVAAHTSAGKTVVAEYAIALAQKNLTKCIYTSPIKALSNQKYRDFKEVYEDVGILTGDVQINPEASCLIMTTEILRSMLYRGADLIRDVEFVIFDEVHYVNDQDRGVVWEETIIMLPEHVKFVLLSATVPNTFEFADWVGRTKKKDIYVISTSHRPVPLEHYLWAKNTLNKIVDAEGKFLTEGWSACDKAIRGVSDKGPSANDSNSGGQSTRGGSARGGARGGRGARGGSRGGGSRGGGYAPSRGGYNSGGPSSASNRFGARGGSSGPSKNSIIQLCHYLQKHKQLPAVFFVFSQKRCQEYALYLSSVDFSTAKEKSEIRMFIDKCVSRLKKEDRDLPQIVMMRDLLSRGIGIHHGGLLPIVKEIIEILFAKTLVKVLFATETVAMGLNLPTRTVVYTGTRKNDGTSFRNLLPGEYTQMSGRAGRRGLDPTGSVIIMVNDPEPPTTSALKAMMLGKPKKLHSQFRLTYSMILNLLRVEALKVEEMIKRSFSEHATQSLVPSQEENVKLNQQILANFKRTPCPICDQDIDDFYDKAEEVMELGGKILKSLKTAYRAKILTPGRLVVANLKLAGKASRLVIGVLIHRKMAKDSKGIIILGDSFEYLPKSITLPFLPDIPRIVEGYYLNNIKVSPSLRRITVPIESIVTVGSKIQGDLTQLHIPQSGMLNATRRYISGCLAYPDRLSFVEVNPTAGGAGPDSMELIHRRKQLLRELQDCKCISCRNFPETYSQLHQQRALEADLEQMKKELSEQNMALLPDYEQRISVLRELNYIDEGLNVLLKGRVACEIGTGFELIVTELLLNNFLGEYQPDEIVALLSVFVYEGGTKVETPSITPRLDEGKQRILDLVKMTHSVFEKYQVQMTPEEAEFAEKNRFGLMEVVYEWARGMSFHEITQLTDVPEGKIVRVITRLDEICREVMAAAKLVGDTSLHDKMESAKEKIKRDIIFCASLYL